MASWVFCNCCFQPPSQASCFSLTNCGHVYCEACLGKGKKDECMICKVPCRTVLLSKHTNSEIQTFFMDIDDLCKKFSRDMSQILEFQEMHRKRLLAFYREQISMLEESLRTSWLRIEELWSMRSSQQAAFSPIRNSVSTPYAKPGGRLWQPLSSLARDSVHISLKAWTITHPGRSTGWVDLGGVLALKLFRGGFLKCRNLQNLEWTVEEQRRKLSGWMKREKAVPPVKHRGS
ncbi:probable E3 SUMO-protein ligase RNF212 [Cynocephalus volans]|uniref:probable E3 SUMO-protein ligase RNF212 n=1 Tax=Cynocephalus volans TaxID=110931 RepID=UPI002FC7F0A5